jgi:hypothetical protein
MIILLISVNPAFLKEAFFNNKVKKISLREYMLCEQVKNCLTKYLFRININISILSYSYNVEQG